MIEVGRPLRRDAERNRQLLLRTARELMARDGLGVTYEAIAQAAGTGTGTVYRRFPDRRDLVDALFAEHLEAVIAIAERACEAEDAWTGLAGFLEQQLELEAGNRGLGELLRGPDKSSTLVRRCSARLTPLAARLVERAVRAGQVPSGVTPADLVAVHLMVGAVMEAARPVDPELWRRALAVALAGLRHAELPGPRPPDTLINHLYGNDEAGPHGDDDDPVSGEPANEEPVNGEPGGDKSDNGGDESDNGGDESGLRRDEERT